MVNANEFKTAKYINATMASEDKALQGKLRIASVDETEIEGKRKLVIGMQGIQNKLALNQTNLKTLINSLGPDTDKWVGAEISLKVVPTTFNGQATASVVLVR